MEIDDRRLHELVFQAAGVGSGAVMRLAPDVVMPDQEICEGLNILLNEFEVPVVEGYKREEVANG